jgi:hypothetical protein
MPERSTAALMAIAAIVGDFVLLKAPRYAFATGVRATETNTASLMIVHPDVEDRDPMQSRL